VASVNKEAATECLVSVSDMRGLEEVKVEASSICCHQPVENLDCFVLDNVLSEQECKYLVEKTEEMGYSFWDSRPDRVTDFRDADTIEVHHPDLAALLWERAAPFLSENVVINPDDDENPRWQRDLEGTWEPVGTNEHVLFARYDAGGHFAPHTDGFSVVSCDERSMYSIVLFLNACTDGGGTRFYADEQRDKLVKDERGRYTGTPEMELTTVDPKVGRMVVFFHNILHQGVGVGAGAKKYIIRSDVMYKRQDPICKTPQDHEAFDMYQRAQELSTAGEMEEATRLFRRAFRQSPALADVYGM